MKYYAVRKGREPGIFDTWDECKKSIHKFKKAEYKSFSTLNEAKKYLKINKEVLIEEEEKEDVIFVYTDGAYKNFKAGIGIYFGENDERNLSKRLKKDSKLTNNISEIKAIIYAYIILQKEIKKNQKITIISDSKYAIRSATDYGAKCELNNFKNIPNKDLVKTIYKLFKGKENVLFLHINSHTGRMDGHYLGNYHADRLATEAIK